MNADVGISDIVVELTQLTTRLCLRHKVGEAHEEVAEDEKGTLVESFHIVGELRVERLVPLKEYHHSHSKIELRC